MVNNSGVLDPTWDCLVDGGKVDPGPPPSDYNSTLEYNNWVFCNFSDLVGAPHVITVNVTVLTNQTFWFDDIHYLPSASVPLDQSDIIVYSPDPEIQYDSGWWFPWPKSTAWESSKVTNVTGSSLTFKFFGMQTSYCSPPRYSYNHDFRCFPKLVWSSFNRLSSGKCNSVLHH